MIGLPALTHTVDQLVAELDRRSPVVEVIGAQAQYARDTTQCQLLKTVDRKEVAMMVPLVFLFLPVTIVFAVLPGVAVLPAPIFRASPFVVPCGAATIAACTNHARKMLRPLSSH